MENQRIFFDFLKLVEQKVVQNLQQSAGFKGVQSIKNGPVFKILYRFKAAEKGVREILRTWRVSYTFVQRKDGDESI